MSNYTPEAANSTFRTTGAFYRALISRPTEKIKRYTIAAGATALVMTKGNPHTVTIRNVGTVDVRYAHEEEEAESTTEYLELNAGDRHKFEYHISGYEIQQVGRMQVLKAIFHCEWSDDLYVYNPSATTSAIVEVLVIG